MEAVGSGKSDYYHGTYLHIMPGGLPDRLPPADTAVPVHALRVCSWFVHIQSLLLPQSERLDSVNNTGISGLGPMTSLTNGSSTQLVCPSCTPGFQKQITMLPVPHCACVPGKLMIVSVDV